MTSETPDPTYDYKAAKRRAAWIQGVRDMADFFEKNPQLKHPRYDTINIMLDTKEDLAVFARIGGWTKEYSDSWFMLRRQFGEDLTLDINVQRNEVCRKVVTGTRVVPTVEAKPEHEEEVFEWVCDDAVLLAQADDPRRI